MNLAQHLEHWLSLEGQEAKFAYIMQNADPLMGDEAKAELERRLGAAHDANKKRLLQEYLQMREAIKTFAQQAQNDPLALFIPLFEQAKDVDDVASLVSKTPDNLLDQIEQRLEENLTTLAGNAKAAVEARLKGLRAVREAEKAFNEAENLSRSPVERAVLEFLQAETDLAARAHALANRDLLLTAQAQAEIDTYRESDHINERKALLRQLRLELQKPIRSQTLPPGNVDMETSRSPSRETGESDTVHAQQPLNYAMCQFGHSNVMINNIERVPLEWRKPSAIRSDLLINVVGRSPELQTVRDKLLAGRFLSVVSVYGLPAIGKTTLAALYARTYQDEYPGGIIWLDYRPDITTTEQAKVVLRQAARCAYDEDIQAIEILENKYAIEPEVVKGLWSGHGRLLIIVDDIWFTEVAYTVSRAIPDDAHVLLTTRDMDVARAFAGKNASNVYELDVLSDDDARLLIQKIYPDIAPTLRDKLVVKLDGYAQALILAASALERNQDAGQAQLETDCDEILRRVHEGEGFGDLPELKDDLRKEVSIFEAVLKYSYDRLPALNPVYQDYFRALGTLAEGATFNTSAFSTVCDLKNGFDALKEFKRLGLVKAIPGEDGAPARWSQHAILRAYALGLQTPDERLDLPERHAEYYAQALRDADKAYTLYKMYDELPNLRKAFYWSVEQKFDLADNLLQNMSDVFSGFNLGREYFEWAELLIEKSQRHGDGRQQLIARMRRASASVNLSRVEATVEGRRKRLLDALADYNEALPLMEGVPSETASTLNNRAVVQRELAPLESTLEGRRKRLLDALKDIWEALKTFSALGIHQYIEVTRNVLLRTAIVCGFTLFSELWREITAEESLPKFEGQAVFSAFAQLEGVESDEQFRQRLQEDAEFRERLEDIMQLASDNSAPNIAPEQAQELQALADLLIEWVQTADWEASQAFMEAHQADLLTDEAVNVMQRLIQGNDGNQTLVQHLNVLQTAIANGIEAAYAPLRKSPFEQLQELRQVFDRMQKPEEMQAVIAMWLMLGQHFLQQKDIPQDHLTQFSADCETVILPRAVASSEAQLVDACKSLLGQVYNSLNVEYDNQKDYPRALAAISKALEYQPQQAMYYRNRAGTHMDMKAYASALSDLEKAQELEPDAQRLPELWKTYHEGMAKPDDEN